jgi:small subunit ribosomal protein S10
MNIFVLNNNKINRNKSIIYFKFKSFHPIICEKAVLKIIAKIESYNIETSLIHLPIKIQRFTVLRSPHIDKKSREQFEIKSHQRLLKIKIDFFNLNNIFLIKYLINYIKNSTAGCSLKIKYFI